MITFLNQNGLGYQREHGKNLCPASAWQNTAIRVLKLNVHYVISFL